MNKVYYFCDYLLDEFENDSTDTEEHKKKHLFKILKKELKGTGIVSDATLKLWCGIEGHRKPSREKLLQMALVLKMEQEQLERAFEKGMQEPGVQVNDYREIIYYYGIQNHLTLEECEAMIHVFETQLHMDTVLEQKTHTEELWSSYEVWKDLDKEHFLFSICENAGKFKGYSKTSLNYFVKLRSEILQYVRKEAKNQLMSLLADTDFFAWARNQRIEAIDYDAEIRRYLKNEKRRKESNLNKNKIMDIEYYHWICYAKEDRNTDLIAELYAGALQHGNELRGKSRKFSFQDRTQFDMPEGVKFMSNTYLSHLLHIGVQKERDIRLSELNTKLLEYEDEDDCPKWAEEYLTNYLPKALGANCGGIRKILKKETIAQRKKCILVERGDLLPLVHCLAYKQYTERQQEFTLEYNKEDATKNFVELANATLMACQMPVLNENFALDRFLLSSFGKKEMLSFAELIEETAV